ncbi:MAG TPA: hypothetical protein VD905_13340 [Flavobacteriales bacterium]|nr:hypothetical protein [Flavobacteriales bacterium]
MKKVFSFTAALICLLAVSCKKDKPVTQPSPTTPAGPKLIIKLQFDSTQARLDNFGNPSTIPAGHAAQSPVFFGLSAHFIELSQNDTVMPGNGEMLYKGVQTSAGGDVAADFDQAIVKGNNETFLTIPLSSIVPGTYNYLRASITYQNYDIKYKVGSTGYVGRLSSFVGWNTYLTDYTIKTQSVTVNANKLQGYFGFEGPVGVIQGQTPAGATTVPNPIAATSPIPAGSCLVTGQFAAPFTITGSETNDITIVLSLSTNKSFEWKDNNANGTFEPLGGDTVVNMGLRGLIPMVQ